MNPAIEAGSLSALAGMFLSMGMKYIPRLNTTYTLLSKEAKSGIMAILIAAVGVGSAFWTCNESSIGMCANGIDWKMLALSVFSALSVNQTTNDITPDPKAVREIKATQAAEIAAKIAAQNAPKVAYIDRQAFLRK